MWALKTIVYALGICNHLAVFGLELLTMALVFLYLLDKGWGGFWAAVITLSIVGTIVTSLYAGFSDGYWTPTVVGLAGIVVAVTGPLILAIPVSIIESREERRVSKANRRRTASVWVEDYPDNWDDLRRETYSRFNYTCANCGETERPLHAHHVVPLSLGGSNSPSNLIALCEDCHESLHPHMRD